ncbi:MAG: hypothetical protein LLF98_13010 [Clostridium sp.]|uniref:hypothetical protein n=1 Tax=Clostridium sp. TaxID=1506 RepID=UPI0025BA9A99|nr:hypothetical protein [Clostridium sp.]MCE5222126.1 hypothetical protein [Clostridium sp.]
MKYYELMRTGMPVEFAYCTEKELEKVKTKFYPNIGINEITEEQYKLALEKKYHKFF